MPSIAWIAINSIFLLGLAVFLVVALKRLEDTPRNKKLRTAALSWCVLFGIFLLWKGYVQDKAMDEKYPAHQAATQ